MNTLELLEVLQQQMQRIDGRTSPWDSRYTFNFNVHDEVHLRLLYFDEVNSFPCICMSVEREAVLHAESNTRYRSILLELRGYCHSEDVQQSGEHLAQDIEHVIQYMRQEHPEITEIRIQSVQTDSGLNSPYGACIIQIEAIL